ncbi:carbohydrate-binding module family 18 protein, partial [Zopfia rhizophila CBS 207.26]
SSDGLCGSNSPINATCAGRQFGDCCSFSEFCGSTGEYCGAGCQSEFGKCVFKMML